MEIKDLMKARRIERNITLKELAAKVGVSESTISRYESGDIANMKVSIIKALSESLGIPPMMFIDSQIGQNEIDNKSRPAIKLPILGDIAGGVPIEAIMDSVDKDDPFQWEEIPASWGNRGKEFIALRVKGDSMSPRIADGDIAIIERSYGWANGAVMAVYVNGYNATLKRVRCLDNGTIVLEAFNPDYETKVYTQDEVKKLPVTPLGILVEVRSKWN